MNLSNSKHIILLILLLAPVKIFSQNDTYNSWLQRLIPRYGKIQFAGSMGMFSLGGGWNYGKNHWETDVLFGIVPKHTTNVHSDLGIKELKTMATFTLKQNYIPWNVALSNNIYFEPLSCALYINTLVNDKFWARQPSKYPDGYYFFSTKIRTLISLGERITYQFKKGNKRRKSITFFYEVGTCDIYLLTALQNKVLKPKDYLSLSLGVKFQYL